MIHARNAVDTHAHDFVANRELLLSIFSASAQCSRLTARYFKCLTCTVCVYMAKQPNNSPLVLHLASGLPKRAKHAYYSYLARYQLKSCGLYCPLHLLAARVVESS